MGDMGDIFRAMAEDKKERKSQNLQKNLDFLNSIDADYEVHNQGRQLNFTFGGGEIVAFYPTTNKWVWRGKVFYGTAENLIGWLKNQEGVKP